MVEAPEDSPAKVAAAIAADAKVAPGETVLALDGNALYDNAGFGGVRDGDTVTAAAVVDGRDMWSAAWRVPLADL
jgi:hypothetical protein